MKKVPVVTQQVFDEQGEDLETLVLEAFRLWLQERLTSGPCRFENGVPDVRNL